LAAQIEAVEAAEEFISEGLIAEVLAPLKSGKEATTWLCRAGREIDAEMAVLKVYHEQDRRNFANDTVYQDGRVILVGQVARAVAKKTEFGYQARNAMWVDHEYETLTTLFDAGADVPEPFACNEGAILMAFVGEGAMAAPQLQHAALSPEEARAAFSRLMWNVETWLAADVVHADLSAFNVLYDRGRVVVIDFPQAVDPRFAPAARSLLERDLTNVSRYFRRHGIVMDAKDEAARLWEWWKFGAHGRRYTR
jgi:RIO kinase 1